MAFLAPLFLAALVAVAVPILVHLTHRERREPVIFPSLMFLQKIPFRTQSRQRIRHWGLFLLRAAAVMLLAAAFSRPFLRGAAAADAAGTRRVIVLLDRSASMGARGRWDRALAQAREAIAALGAGDQAGLIVFDETPEALVEPTPDRAVLEAALGRVQPGPAAGRIGPALRMAAALIEDAGGPAEVVLISDFQRGGWSGDASVMLPTGVALRTVDAGDSALVNAAVAGLVLEHLPGEPARTAISARVAATGGAARDVPVTLVIEGRDIQTVTVRLAPGATAAAGFDPVRSPDQPRRARIRIPADDFDGDDTHDFVLGTAARLGVLLISRGDAQVTDHLYLRRALGVAREPSFPVVMRSAAQVRPTDLAEAAVVVLHDVPFPGGDAGRRLVEWVTEGGGLFVATGARGTLPPEIADSVLIALRPTDRGESGAATAATDPAHPAFGGWDEALGDPFAGSRTFRYRVITGTGRPLARYDDGATALAELRYGAGRILVWGADLANRWSDLPLAPAFVPLVHGATRHLAGWTPARPAYTVGEVAALPRPAGAGAMVHERPGGERETLPDSGSLRVMLRDRGFHVVRGASERAGTLLAANVPPAESDPARLDQAALTAAVSRAGSAAGNPAVARSESESERRQRLWWYVLAIALAVLATESVVAYRARRI